MQTLLGRLLKNEILTKEQVQLEHDQLAKRLEILHMHEKISIDAFLAAGAIQGGLEILSTLVGLNVEREEVIRHLNSMLERAARIHEAHPGLNQAIEELEL